jgi:hypothetical protein
MPSRDEALPKIQANETRLGLRRLAKWGGLASGLSHNNNKTKKAHLRWLHRLLVSVVVSVVSVVFR